MSLYAIILSQFPGSKGHTVQISNSIFIINPELALNVTQGHKHPII